MDYFDLFMAGSLGGAFGNTKSNLPPNCAGMSPRVSREWTALCFSKWYIWGYRIGIALSSMSHFEAFGMESIAIYFDCMDALWDFTETSVDTADEMKDTPAVFSKRIHLMPYY